MCPYNGALESFAAYGLYSLTELVDNHVCLVRTEMVIGDSTRAGGMEALFAEALDVF
jgi:hypothetical protein